MKVTPFKIEKFFNNTQVTLYPSLIQVSGKNYLVDCGYEETFGEFITALGTLGISVRDLDAVIISHDDIDHLGALSLFKNFNQNLLIYSSEVEEPSVSGKVKSERLLQAENSLGTIPVEHKDWALQFIQQVKGIQRVAVDLTLKDQESIVPDLIVIDTPGHTKGHFSLYIPSQSTLIANDALVIEGNELNIANPEFTLDLNAALRSVEKIRDLQPKKLVCYHGGTLEENLGEKLNSLLKRYQC